MQASKLLIARAGSQLRVQASKLLTARAGSQLRMQASTLLTARASIQNHRLRVQAFNCACKHQHSQLRCDLLQQQFEQTTAAVSLLRLIATITAINYRQHKITKNKYIMIDGGRRYCVLEHSREFRICRREPLLLRDA